METERRESAGIGLLSEEGVELKKAKILLDSVRRLLRKQAKTHLKRLLSKRHPADIAYIMKHLSEKERKEVLQLLDPETVAQMLPKLDSLSMAEILELIEPEELAEYMKYMPPDDAIILIDSLPKEKKQAVMELIEKYPEIWKLLQYGEETAGRIMSTDFVALDEDLSVEEAIKKVREAREKEVFYIYVVDKRGHLVGVLSLRQLILSDPNKKLKEIMNPDVIFVTVDTDQEEVARIVQKYDLLAVPVVDENKRLVGIVTTDDVIDIIIEEATEDIYKMVGTTDEELWEKSLIKIAFYRLPWLSFTIIGEMISGAIIKMYQHTLKEFIAISFFLPLVMALGGNVGNQSQTIMVRALATGRIDPDKPWKVMFRQIGVGFIMGLIAGAVAGGVVYIIQSNHHLALAIAISLLLSMTITATVGSIVPIIFKKLNIDPALPSGPFITTFSDILGNLIYLSLATFLLIKFGN